MKNLKTIFIILLVILISLISFGGIFIQDTKFVKNIIPNYKLGMDFTGGRVIGFDISTAKNTVIYDKDGKVVENEGEGTTKKEEPVNPEEILTKENYKEVKKILEQRLNDLNTGYYTLRFDEENGKAYVQIPENELTDNIVQYVAIKGVFQIVDDDKNVLLTNEHVKKAQVGYSNSASGTAVYLTIKFNEEGKRIFRDITNTYVKTTDEEGKETTKQITLKIDDTSLIQTYFENEITDGTMRLSIGQATTNNDDLDGYIREGASIAALLNSGALPITYTIEENRYVMSDLSVDMFFVPIMIVAAAFTIGILFLIIGYGKNGFFSAIGFIANVAIYLLLIRYTNVIVTLESMAGILIAIILNFIFNVYLLHVLKQQKETGEISKGFESAILKTIFVLVPVAIISVILCFTGWLPVSSFAMTMFWGILVSVLSNLIITKTLIIANNSK